MRYRLLPLGRMRSRVSSQRVCGSPGLTEKLKSSMSRMGQMGSLIWMFIGMYVAVRGLEVERGQVDGDAIEAGVHVLPAVGCRRGRRRLDARGSRRG